jgi:DNA-binding HxlR family transcriptional regulator
VGEPQLLHPVDKKLKLLDKFLKHTYARRVRSYGEYCSIARSLDVLGDRWTLLIIRELLGQGPCRYTDLRRGLPGIATNLLGDRLRELEDAGVLTREEAPPPVPATLFRLTERGEDLRPVLDHLRRWGMPLMAVVRPNDVVHSEWLAGVLAESLQDSGPAGAAATLVLDVGDKPIEIRLGDGRPEVGIGAAQRTEIPRGDLTISGPPPGVMGLLLGALSPAEASARGVQLDGDAAIHERIARPVRSD